MYRHIIVRVRRVVYFALFLSQIGYGQAQSDSLIISQIDAQVWYPFITSFGAYDGPAFNALHTPDVLRAGPWGIRQGDEYLQANLEGNARNNQQGNTRQIAFTFEHRVHSPEVAYEVGYYRLVQRQRDLESESYGQFHVVLRKINGVWKIAQDWDASTIADIPVTAEHFQKYAHKGVYE